MKKFRLQTKLVLSTLAVSFAVSYPAVFANATVPKVAVSTSASAAPQVAPIHWATSFQAAQQQARTSKKLIMIDFFTDWCGWCKALDEQTYPDSRVKVLSSNFVTVKLDAEKGGAKLAEKYGVDGYPTIMFVNADGSVVKKIDGFQNGDDFTVTLAQILKTNSASSLQQLADNQPSNVKSQTSMAVLSAALGSMDDAQKYQKKAEAADPHNQQGVLCAGYQAIAENYFSKKQYAQSIDHLKRQINTCGNMDEAIVAKLMLATSYAVTKQSALAIQLTQEELRMPQATQPEKDLANKLQAYPKAASK